jgi:hypothetical protein
LSPDCWPRKDRFLPPARYRRRAPDHYELQTEAAKEKKAAGGGIPPQRPDPARAPLAPATLNGPARALNGKAGIIARVKVRVASHGARPTPFIIY